MAESTLHPRPEFATFLQSDANGMRDSLSYYERQRVLRYQKVAILQQKRENAYIPGYRKRPATVPAPRSLAERAETFSKFGRPKSAAHTVTINPFPVEIEYKLEKENKGNTSSVFTASSAKMSQPSMIINQADLRPESKPIIATKQRNIRSATICNNGEGNEEDSEIVRQRPVTVPGDVGRDNSRYATNELDIHGKSNSASPPFKRKDVKEPVCEISEVEADTLYKSYQWGTTTQRAYNDAGWERKMDKRVKEHPKAGFRNLPDPVTYRLTYRRYNSDPGYWQSFGCNWDYIQPRRGDTYMKGPQSMLFHTTYPVMQQIPGYSGYSPALANYEFDQSNAPSPSVVRSVKPHYKNISRNANIPGYTGCIHWSNPNQAHANMSFPEPTTSARIHREIPLENEISPFRRDGVLSRMVTTVPPSNPFRKILY